MNYSETDIAKIKEQVIAANDIIWNQRTSPKAGVEPIKMIQDAYEKSVAINFKFGVGRCLLNQGMGAFILDHNYIESDKLIIQSREIFTEINDQKWIANAYLTQAIIKNSTGNPESALYLGLKGMEYYTSVLEDDDYRMACYVVGTIYKDLKKINEAETYFKKGIAVDMNHTGWSARLYTGTANILNDRGDYQAALEMADKALKLLRDEENEIGVSRALNDMGAIYHKLKEYDKALNHIFEALKIRKENNLKHFILGSLIDIANIYFEKGDFENALPFYLEAEPLAISTNHPNRLLIIYKAIANIFKNNGDLASAVNILEKLIEVSNTLNKLEKEKKITQTENTLLKEKEDEIERLRNVELKNAYDVIAEKNKEITDSIHYAKRIQKTILAPESELKIFLKDYFIYFQPKDIVSGDFYWSIATQSKNKVADFYLAVCDSTGHGVPGAFMSLLNTNLLNEAIYEKQISEPHLVFNYVRQRLIDSISKEGQKDGFDGILAKLNLAENKLVYAAANNAPILIRNSQITELPTDKMPVGYGEKKDSFSLHTITLEKGDAIYFFTDGYADQFGGPSGKKFKYKPLNELLRLLATDNTTTQLEKIKTTFENWKGNLEQVDDVCIVGLRI